MKTKLGGGVVAPRVAVAKSGARRSAAGRAAKAAQKTMARRRPAAEFKGKARNAGQRTMVLAVGVLAAPEIVTKNYFFGDLFFFAEVSAIAGRLPNCFL